MSEFKIYESIDPINISKTPFNANKLWSLTNNDFNISGGNYLFTQAIYHDNQIFTYGTENYNELKNWDNSYQKIVYYSLESLYYSNVYYINLAVPLSKYVNIFSISKNKFGTSIKPESISLNYTDILNVTHSISDDGNYKLIDNSIDSSNFIPSSSLVAYYSFNEKFNNSNSIILDNSYVKNHAYATTTVTYSDGITNTSNKPYGFKAQFNGVSSYISSSNNNSINFTNNQNFAISFWTTITTGSLSSGQLYILSKRREGISTVVSNNDLTSIVYDYNSSSYPFDIYFDIASNFLYCKRSDSINTNTVSASISFISGSSNQLHVLYQKTGSNLELYINNSKVCTVSDTCVYNVHTNSDLYIGSLGNSRNVFSGSIDEVRIYNTSLTTNQITSLSTLTDSQPTAFQSNVVGNVFYEQGMIIYSPIYKHAYDSLSGSNYNLQYKSTVSLTEHTYICRVPADQYNFSTNQSLYNSTGSLISTYNNENFHPYITTIGLYNSKYELIAVAKLASPIPKLNTVDLNFMIKFDVW